MFNLRYSPNTIIFYFLEINTQHYIALWHSFTRLLLVFFSLDAASLFNSHIYCLYNNRVALYSLLILCHRFSNSRRNMTRHLGIRSSGNPPSQRVPSLFEGVGSIPGIFKILNNQESRFSYFWSNRKKSNDWSGRVRVEKRIPLFVAG